MSIFWCSFSKKNRAVSGDSLPQSGNFSDAMLILFFLHISIDNEHSLDVKSEGFCRFLLIYSVFLNLIESYTNYFPLPLQSEPQIL